MNNAHISCLVKLRRDPLRFAEEFKIPLIAGFACGFAAHMSAFTNKYINADELEYLFSKGATLASGRWALALTSALFPDVSMPWVYGVLTIALLTLAACVIVAAFDIKNRLFQFALAGLIVAQPVETLTFAYTFTSVSYAMAVLLIALSIYIYIMRMRNA